MNTYHELPPDDRILEIDRDRMAMRFLDGPLPEGIEPVIERNAFPLHVGFLLYAKGSNISPETRAELLRRHLEAQVRGRLPLPGPVQYAR